ncbi:MAG: leucine-rich repeat protein [Bacteroidales bacterium]|nr:leucine-rich repeat protein [Bacteroidales bacterium]
MVNVYCATDWTVENTATDIFATSLSTTTLTVTAVQNYVEQDLSPTITFCTAAHRITYEYINVTQDAKAYVTLSVERVSLIGIDDSATVTVESNFEWDYSYEVDNGWYIVSRDGDNIVITSTANNETDEDLEDIITITAGDGVKNVDEAHIYIVEENNTNALILVYTITEADTKVTLPLQGTVNCTVSWGDVSSDTVTSTKPTHTYETVGEYTVVINGTVTLLSHSGITSASAINTTLTAVKQWGNTGLTSVSDALDYCEGLTSVPADTQESFANVTTCAYMFYYCTALTSVQEGLFAKCTSASTFQYTFRNCSSIKEIPSGLLDNCIAATSFYYTFSYMDGLTIIPEALFSKNNNVNTFYGCFSDDTSLTTIPANLFANCSKATTFGYAFYDDAALTTISESAFTGCSGVTTFTYCFANCPALTSVPENLFKDCTAVTTSLLTGSSLMQPDSILLLRLSLLKRPALKVS